VSNFEAILKLPEVRDLPGVGMDGQENLPREAVHLIRLFYIKIQLKGVSMSKIKFKCYAKPVDWKLPDGTPLGDHTWVAADQQDVCWSALGSSDEKYYCGSDHWKSGHYKHGGSRTLPESDEAKLKAVECMGSPKRSHIPLTKLPSSAGIAYGVHGVCHEISNRILYYTGATVEGADGYRLTRTLYGVYGTDIPAFIYDIPILREIAVLLQADIWGDWLWRVGKCWFKTTEEQDDSPQRSPFLQKVIDLHQSFDKEPVTNRTALRERHMQEVDLMLADALGEDYDRQKLAAMSEAFGEVDRRADVPEKFAVVDIETVTDIGLPDFDPVELVMQMNRGVRDTLDLFAEALGGRAYEALLGSKPGEFVSFLNPDGFRA
jgi:hypothetical protein